MAGAMDIFTGFRAYWSGTTHTESHPARAPLSCEISCPYSVSQHKFRMRIHRTWRNTLLGLFGSKNDIMHGVHARISCGIATNASSLQPSSSGPPTVAPGVSRGPARLMTCPWFLELSTAKLQLSPTKLFRNFDNHWQLPPSLLSTTQHHILWHQEQHHYSHSLCGNCALNGSAQSPCSSRPSALQSPSPPSSSEQHTRFPAHPRNQYT